MPSPPSEVETNAIKQLLELACAASRDAGEAIMEIYASGDFGEEQKEDNSPLTRADQAAHQIITEKLQATGLPILSEEGLHETYEERVGWDWYWMIDPLDGTKEFLKKNGEFTVNIALMQQSTPVAGVIYIPVTDTLYYGSKETGVHKVEDGESITLQPLKESVTFEQLVQQEDITIVASRTHLNPETIAFTEQFRKALFKSMGSSLKFMLLAEGQADIYPRYAPTMEWDTAAAHAILRAVGRKIYKTDMRTELQYNKPDLRNPSFIAF